MTIIEMLKQSAILTALGMAVVFVFLWVMIIFVDIAGRIIRRSEPVGDGQRKAAEGGGQAAAPPEIAAAITAAVI
jgi:sodium pump decarboxylase gamma subunit